MIEDTIHPHVPSERAHLFSANDSQGTEDEYLHLLEALVGVEKPTLILETGTYKAQGTLALARSCQANGQGRVITIEQATERAVAAEQYIHAAGLSAYVKVIQHPSVSYLANRDPLEQFDLLFFDSDLLIRIDEFMACFNRGTISRGALVIFHDTSRVRTTRNGDKDPRAAAFWSAFERCVRPHAAQVIEFPLSRGMTLVRMP